MTQEILNQLVELMTQHTASIHWMARQLRMNPRLLQLKLTARSPLTFRVISGICRVLGYRMTIQVVKDLEPLDLVD